jgi:hypothetical protein
VHPTCRAPARPRLAELEEEEAVYVMDRLAEDGENQLWLYYHVKLVE